MRRRGFLLGATALAVAAAFPAAAQTMQDQVIAQLRRQGYSGFRVSRTLLGRVRILASGPGGEREIILNPGTGTVLRDHIDRDNDRDDDRDDDRGDDDRDDHDDDVDDRDDDVDDDDDDDDDDNDGDGGDNSGSGGGGDDDDDD